MTFYFYDLETSGFDARTARIMQFAGQRTDMNLKPLGRPDNILIKLTPDILPEPDAVLVHGITPQKTIAEGITEAELVKYLTNQVFIQDTIVVGFNNVRFDDEFIRFLFWRNFQDPYEWQWKDGRSRWDLLDIARMTRALRPSGINWAFASDGTPSNKLADLAEVNNLEHESAHDALSDVRASMAVARLIASKQPKLFDYLLKMRDKTKVATLVESGKPFVYTSGRYSVDYEKTTVAVMLAKVPGRNSALVYDLRVNPKDFNKQDVGELVKAWQQRGRDAPYFPAKVLAYNKCPSIAPMAVLDKDSAKRLKIDSRLIESNFAELKKAGDLGDKLIRCLEIIQPSDQPGMIIDEQDVDASLYSGFVNDADRVKMRVVRAAGADELDGLSLDFADERLEKMLPLYKARNFPSSLGDKEEKWWNNFRTQRLMAGGNDSRAAKYFARLAELDELAKGDSQTKYLLEELQLYGQSVVPFEF